MNLLGIKTALGSTFGLGAPTGTSPVQQARMLTAMNREVVNAANTAENRNKDFNNLLDDDADATLSVFVQNRLALLKFYTVAKKFQGAYTMVRTSLVTSGYSPRVQCTFYDRNGKSCRSEFAYKNSALQPDLIIQGQAVSDMVFGLFQNPQTLQHSVTVFMNMEEFEAYCVEVGNPQKVLTPYIDPSKPNMVAQQPQQPQDVTE